MKRLTAWILTLAMLMTGSALAEAEKDFFDHLRDAWDGLVDGAGAAGDAVSGYLEENLPQWRERGEQWLREAQEWLGGVSVPEELADAWKTLEEAAAGLADAAKASDAYEEIRRWLEESGAAANEALTEALDALASEAGVAEAELRRWTANVQDYIDAHADEVTRQAEAAWTQIRDAATQAGATSLKALAEAFDALSQWIAETDPQAEATQSLERLEDELLQAEQ